MVSQSSLLTCSHVFSSGETNRQQSHYSWLPWDAPWQCHPQKSCQGSLWQIPLAGLFSPRHQNYLTRYNLLNVCIGGNQLLAWSQQSPGQQTYASIPVLYARRLLDGLYPLTPGQVRILWRGYRSPPVSSTIACVTFMSCADDAQIWAPVLCLSSLAAMHVWSGSSFRPIEGCALQCRWQ